MKKQILPFLFLVFGTGLASAQTRIKLEEVKLHVGDSVTVCGKVFGARFLENANGQPTLINVGGAYPNELLTVVVFGSDRAQFKDKPEESFTGKEVCITGRITMYKEKPQIVVAKKEQIQLP